MPRYFEVFASDSGAVARPAVIGALPARVEAMGSAASFTPTEEDLAQIEARLVERSRGWMLKGVKVVWRISDDGKLAEVWEWPAAPELAPYRVQEA
jgi:hypothetical protein